MKETITKEIELPKEVTVNVDGSVLKVNGGKGEVTRDFRHPRVQISMSEGKVVVEAKNGTKREKKMIGSFVSHIKNMIAGVQEPHKYVLKICSGHFPMNVTVSGEEVVVKNFLGEAVPRRITVLTGADVKVNGDEVVVSSSDKEVAGQMAARIENLCRITNKDRRIFQDGIYMTHKAGKDIV